MLVLERLENLRVLRMEAKQLSNAIRELEVTALRSPQFSGTPRSHSRAKANLFESLIIQREDLYSRYIAKQAEVYAHLLAIESLMEAISSRDRMILRLYYIEGLTWDQVCTQSGYSWQQTFRIKKEAIDKLEQLHASTGDSDAKAEGPMA